MLNRRHTVRLRKRDNLLMVDGGGVGGGGAKSYDGEKVWASINQSILSGFRLFVSPTKQK